MYVLMATKPGTLLKAVFLRDGKEQSVDVTMQDAARKR